MSISTRSLVSVVSVVLLASWTGSAGAAGVVGTGTAGSCTEAALDTALTGGGTVTFSCGVAPVTISITTTKNVSLLTTISGADLITLDGGGTTAFFNVTGGGLGLTHLTLTHGFSSNPLQQAVVNSKSAPVTIDHCNIVANTATDVPCMAIVVSDAALAIQFSTVANNIGSGTTGSNVICTNNTATLTVLNSTITGNTTYGGGGIFVTGSGSLIFSTVTNNTSNLGNAAVSSFGSGVLNLANSIVANNAGGNCAAVAGGTIVDNGHNLQFPGTTCGVAIPSANPLLGALASNGGPTQTMALQSGSPAFDQIPSGTAGCGTTTTLDQRGVSRPQPAGGPCDIGAYEAPAGLNDLNSVPTLGGWALGAFVLALAIPGLALLRRLG